jgi:hypothetical protein
MESLIASIIASIAGAIMTAFFSYFKKPPEQVQKEKDDEKNKNYLDAVNAGSDGFELPLDAANDKWGTTIAETGTRLESGKTDGTQRQTDSRSVHDGGR